MVSQLDELTATYTQLCDSSAAQVQHLEEKLAKEEKRKVELNVQWEATNDSSVQLCLRELQLLETMLLRYIALKKKGHFDDQELSVCSRNATAVCMCELE